MLPLCCDPSGNPRIIKHLYERRTFETITQSHVGFRSVVAMLVPVTIADVKAAPVQFIHSGNGSGSIGAINFSNADFTLIGNADTNNRESLGNTLSLDHNSTSINISGIGSFQILTGTRTFVAQDSSVVGFSRKGILDGGLVRWPVGWCLSHVGHVQLDRSHNG